MKMHISETEREAVYRVIHARRDMRHFTGGEVPEHVLRRILEAGHAAPSVGLMQPWRFVRIRQASMRKTLVQLVESERMLTAEGMAGNRDAFLRLKVEGMRECAELIAVVMAPDDGTRFGRRTMPQEMALCSVACAIENIWLAARAENLGMGWVSIFAPEAVAALLDCPSGAKPLALLCLGPVREFYDAPMLVERGWREPRPLASLVGCDVYPHGSDGVETAR